MDISEMIEKEKKRQELVADEKVKAKLRRQIYIFNKEKASFTRRTAHEINKQRRCLSLLEKEKDTELDNFLAMRSHATEIKYKREKGVVTDLVKTTDVVRSLLEQEKGNTRSLGKQLDNLTRETWDTKRKTTEMTMEQAKARVPCPKTMDNRIEWSSGKFHLQLAKNRELQQKIDSAIFIREIYRKEETRLQAEVEKINEKISHILVETSEIYEKRERAEATKVKVKDHLNKVRDKFEREMQVMSLSLSEDKKMETFMRTKHKDVTQYLRHQREVEMQKVETMSRQKDEFTKAFDEIKKATGKKDINQIIHDFIEAEEDNFAIFLHIGELLDENEELRDGIHEMTEHNVLLEDEQLVADRQRVDDIKASEARIIEYQQKSEACKGRLKQNDGVIQAYVDDMRKIMEILNIDGEQLQDYLSPEGQVLDRHILDVMTIIETAVGELLKDYYMVELATRALTANKQELTADEVMLTRKPSIQIEPRAPPKTVTVSALRDKEEIGPHEALTHDEVKDVVVKTLLDTAKTGDVTHPSGTGGNAPKL
ncbi:outer dynein arm protein 1 [Aplysia californica]|uniref:Outer dynein arm protein 1 n=1 Tax=Aplysia californica TaxID=6500 RepID=A0ABM1ABD7_APLCA|nr:outer dynein arm protein 1 [Aplysia californica]